MAKYNIINGVGIIPEGTTEIEESAFENCEKLTTIVIPDSVTIIGNSAFEDCTSLTSIVIPDSVMKIDDWAFKNCAALTSIVIPDSVTKIGDRVFMDCTSLTGIVIPDSVTKIGVCTFYGCTSLTKIVIPDSVTEIDSSAFKNCSALTSIVIPDSVMEIDDWAFENCSALKSIIVSSGNQTYDSRNNCNAIIKTKENRLIVGCQNTIIPDSVNEIGGGAFSGCMGLTKIVIPESVSVIDRCIIVNCPNLASVIVSEGNKVFDSRNNCNAIIETVSNKLIVGCSKTIIPNTVSEIGPYAFYKCTSLTNIVIPDSVTKIGSSAFYYCERLENIVIPDSVTEIEEDVFFGCSGMDKREIGAFVSASEYWHLSEVEKDELFRYIIKDLVNNKPRLCDFNSYSTTHCNQDPIKLFNEALPIRTKKYIELLKKTICWYIDKKEDMFEPYITRSNSIHHPKELLTFIIRHPYLDICEDFERLMTVDAQIVKMKSELHLSFIQWLYGGLETIIGKPFSYVKPSLRILFPIEYLYLLNKLKKILKNHFLSLKTLPTTLISYETPPSFKAERVSLKENQLNIEGLLGCYYPSTQEIHLYEIGIQWCANRLQMDADILREIVLIHELGHYIQHKMPCYKTKEWDDQLYNASYSPKDLQEGWAQLMDAWVVEDESEYRDVFYSLVECQSKPYHTFYRYKGYPHDKILESLDGLRQLGRPATTKDWDDILKQ